MITEINVACAARDGVLLRGNVHRPDAGGRFPVLVVRMPFNLAEVGSNLADAERLTASGYSVVMQHVRGRFTSDGNFDPFGGEVEDGADTVAWAAGQPWSNGQVGMFGGSYGGFSQWAAARVKPDGLRALTPSFAGGDFYSWVYPGGALNLLMFFPLGMMVAFDARLRRNEAIADEVAEFVRFGERISSAMRSGDSAEAMSLQRQFQQFLLAEMSRLALDDYPPYRKGAPFFPNWLSHPYRDEYWDRHDAVPGAEQVRYPALQIAGWYDSMARQQLESSSELRSLSGSDGAQRQRLVIGPWTHSAPRSRSAGEMDFGAESVLDLDGTRIAWFDHWLKGTPVREGPPVRLFVMGINRWRDEENWPLARAVPTNFFLQREGRLSRLAPEAQPPDHFTYDPAAPAPTLGGSIQNAPAGVFDQRPVEQRQDVLVYTGEPLSEDLEVTGPVRVHLWAATDGPGTDFTAKLVDVHPNGYAANLCDGILRSTHRDGSTSPTRTEPGVAYEYVIELGPTSNVFKAGHRIRVDISSSNFPRFDRNPNTGVLPASAREFRVARQTVFHEPGRASRIVLSVVPG